MKFIVRHRETGLYYIKDFTGFTRCMGLAQVFDEDEHEHTRELCRRPPEVLEIIPMENE